MPKPLKKKARSKRSKDVNELAHQLVRESTEDHGSEPLILDFKAQLSAYMSGLGRKGGKIGGKRRLTTLTQERRDEIALKAAQARWAKQATKTG
jgi:hypothetical protein